MRQIGGVERRDGVGTKLFGRGARIERVTRGL